MQGKVLRPVARRHISCHVVKPCAADLFLHLLPEHDPIGIGATLVAQGLYHQAMGISQARLQE